MNTKLNNLNNCKQTQLLPLYHITKQMSLLNKLLKRKKRAPIYSCSTFNVAPLFFKSCLNGGGQTPSLNNLRLLKNYTTLDYDVLRNIRTVENFLCILKYKQKKLILQSLKFSKGKFILEKNGHQEIGAGLKSA